MKNSKLSKLSKFISIFKKIGGVVIILFIIAFISKWRHGPELSGPSYMSHHETWGFKVTSDNKYHDPLNIENIQETDGKLKFELTSHMNLSDGSTRKCRFYYSLDKKNGKGIFISKVIGYLDNGVRVKRGEFYLRERTDDKLVFSYIVDQTQLWTRLLNLKENVVGEFILTADP
jgi:hypothetical protein